MIYLYLSGGLGNQFFQYAYGKMIQQRTGDEVTYLSESYKTDELRDLALNKFDIASDWKGDTNYNFWEKHKLLHFYYRVVEKLESVRGERIKDDNATEKYVRKQKLYFKKGIYVHDNHAYIAPETTTGKKPRYVRGLWHHPMYFDAMRQELVKELRLKDCSVLPQGLLADIEAENSVCVHIRRGDYTQYNYYIVCDIDYYERAMAEARKQRPGCKFYVFSDDIEWVKNNLKSASDITFVEEANPDYVDFELMRRCDHFIISNSTFSWWAAYLGEAEDKLVITPDKWYNDGRNKTQLNMEGWTVLNTGV